MLRMTCRGVLLVSLTLGIMNDAVATKQQGWGRVGMQGAIIATACAIATQSEYQAIDMAPLSVSQLMRDGEGPSKPFAIKLVNCSLITPGTTPPTLWQGFEITFDGLQDIGLFGMTGQARGIALQLTDDDGRVASPGVPFSTGKIKEGSMVLNYAFRVVSNRQHLKAGDYYSTVKFKMDYY